MAKRLIFSSATPNDQNGVIPNDVIDFSRYNKNPVLLKEHWWGGDPLGIMTDCKIINGKFSGIPVFHLETQLSREAAGMYEKGALNAASIGGEALWKKNALTDEYLRDEQGHKICEKFYLYEISLVSLPSNPDAVGEHQALAAAKIYEDESELSHMDHAFETFSSKHKPKSQTMEPTPEEIATAKLKADNEAKAKADADKLTLAASGGGTNTDDLPGVIKEAIRQGGSVSIRFAAGAPAPEDTPLVLPPKKDLVDPQPEPIGMAAKAYQAALKKLDRAKNRAEVAINKAELAKKKAEDDETMKAECEAATKEADSAVKECESVEKECDAAKMDAEDEEMAAKQKTSLSAQPSGQRTAAPGNSPVEPAAPKMKTVSELRNSLTLAAAPSFKARVGRDSQGVTFTQLNASKADEKSQGILKRVFNADKTQTTRDYSDHAIVLNSILNDPRLKPIVEKTRLMANVTEREVSSMRDNPMAERGQNLMNLSSDLSAGRVNYRGRDGQMHNLTMLSSTDNALASPALNTIEWLSLAIFQLFPTDTWKANIPLFSAQVTGRNTGLILANITANPNIYKGNSPAPAADYSYQDQAVALALTPYYLQPMLWNPLTMHQLRYDQMATGWAQAFAKWNQVMDDNLIYTLASTVPTGSIIITSGLSGYQTQAMQFNIPASGPQNVFRWNPAFSGSLVAPTLNDTLAIEQLYRNQNFELSREKAVLVLDPIMERYLKQDPETKSLLTRFITTNKEEFVGYSNTMYDVRSQVAVYDPATGQVKDINSAIPATAVSASIGFIPSQVGIGVGMLDIFMIQDPTNYGYRMSGDIRMGIVPLRYNFNGTVLYVYAPVPV